MSRLLQADPVNALEAAIAVYKAVEYTAAGHYLKMDRFRDLCREKYPKIFDSPKRFDELASNQKFLDVFKENLETLVVSMIESSSEYV